MKKTISRFLALALALLLALSLAACGGEEPQSSAPASQFQLPDGGEQL